MVVRCTNMGGRHNIRFKDWDKNYISAIKSGANKRSAKKKKAAMAKAMKLRKKHPENFKKCEISHSSRKGHAETYKKLLLKMQENSNNKKVIKDVEEEMDNLKAQLETVIAEEQKNKCDRFNSYKNVLEKLL